jgi:pyruvate/2-oxoglutarate dehydrogenase complex dihydrolipoamide acyltransferase (E2) component
MDQFDGRNKGSDGSKRRPQVVDRAMFKREGDPVTVHEPLVEIDTDNVTHEIRTPVTAVLSKILVKDGGTIEPGTVLGMIDTV